MKKLLITVIVIAIVSFPLLAAASATQLLSAMEKNGKVSPLQLKFYSSLAVAGANTSITSLTTTGNITSGDSFIIGSADIEEAELEILDGATVTTGELNILDGITATYSELNILDGVTSTYLELNILDGVTATAAEINYLDIATPGTGVASKAVVLDSSGDYTAPAGVWDLSSVSTITVSAGGIEIGAVPVTATGTELNLLDGVTATTNELNILDGVTSTYSELNILDGVTATYTELNIASVPASGIEDTTATNAILATEHGKTFFLNSATEFVSTLPAPAAGLEFKFIVKAAPAGASYTVVTDSSANIMIGGINELEVDTADDGPYLAAGDTITFADGVSVVGDWVSFVSDGTSWYITGQANADGGVTITQAS